MSATILMPKLGMTMKEGTIIEWYKEVGDPVEKGEHVLMISSEKLNQDIEAPISGVLLTKNANVDDELKVGEVIGIIGGEKENVSVENQKVETPASTGVTTSEKTDVINDRAPVKEMKNDSDRIFITPLARRMAIKENLDIHAINGTGGYGRITKLDIQRVLENGLDYQVEELREQSTQVETFDSTAIGEGLSPIRKAIARNMRKSLAQTAQITLHRKVNADRLIEFQKTLRKEAEASQSTIKLTVTTLLARATVLALQELKKMNSIYQNDKLQEFDEVHLGIATSLDDGLLVPVIKNAHQKTLGHLAKDLVEITEKARNGKANQEILTGSSFTITNLGASGIEYFTPILNPPETGILGVGAFQDELILTDQGEVKSVKKIPLSITVDHQIIDGATAAEFLNILIKYIESPYLLVL